jgi:hypothetical protein
MNERIRQFAEQAFDQANDGTITDIKIPKEFIEKFAELIVRECSAVALNIGCGDIEDELLKHFGVEA